MIANEILLSCSFCSSVKNVNKDMRRYKYKFYCKDTCYKHVVNKKREEIAIAVGSEKRKGVILTSVLSGCSVNLAALNSLICLSKATGFELVVAEVKWGTSKDFEYRDRYEDYWVLDNEIYTVGETSVDFALYLNMNANSQNPLGGVAGIAGKHHLVVPHPVIYLETTASPQSEDCRILVTTGTISNFSLYDAQTRVASVTKFHASLGCVVVTEGDYPVNPLTFDTTKSCFSFEGNDYSAFGEVTKSDPILYAYLPDMHLAHGSRQYQLSLYKDLSLFNVRNAIGGDLHDGSSMLHHERDRLGYSAVRMSIFEELNLLKGFAYKIKQITGSSLKMIIGNHETFSDRYFDSQFLSQLNSFTLVEQILILEGMADCLKNTKLTTRGIEYGSMFKYFLKAVGLQTFLEVVDSTLRVNDLLIYLHGNEYLTTKTGTSQSNFKFVLGHTHQPKIFRNTYWVGTGSVLNPTYQSGLTRSAAAHCMISLEGKRTLRVFLPK
jgi:hypothetical protein